MDDARPRGAGAMGALDYNDTRVSYPGDKTVQRLFEEQAARSPGGVALVHKESHLTYDELNRRANRVAHRLIALGVGPDVLVGVCLDRSFDLVVALLGVLKAGGAYLPLDPEYPRDRLSFMLADARVPAVLTCRALAGALPPGDAHVILLDGEGEAPAAGADENPAPRGDADGLAYVNYTSGSTGAPKGVEIPHRGVVRLLFGVDYVSLGPTRALLQLAPISFDAATFEIWGALLHGGRCVLFEHKLPTLDKLRATIERHEVDTVFLTTALFNAIVDEDPGVLRTVSQVFTGGEAHSVAHVRRVLAALPETRITSVYGPTESTTFATYYPIQGVAPDATSIPIGRPIGNTQVYVLDAQLRPVAVGEVGELYIGGAGLARGYLGRPDLTRERFVVNVPFLPPGERLYKTGDLARYLPDGMVDFVGRADDQVKVNGFRIELGEIETRLIAHPAVRQAIVAVRAVGFGEKKLVAYLTPNGGRAEAGALRAHLRQTLPRYMVPAAFEWVDALPLTPNGKVDRKKLLSLSARNATASGGISNEEVSP